MANVSYPLVLVLQKLLYVDIDSWYLGQGQSGDI